MTNNFEANLIVFYRFLSIYLTNKPKVKAKTKKRTWAKVRVKVKKTADIGLRVLLLLIKFSPVLQQV